MKLVLNVVLSPNFLRISFLLIYFLITHTITAQLSGDYSIGDSQSDYENFSYAIADMQNQGIEGDVQFYVKPGIYNNVSIIDISNPQNFLIQFNYDGTVNDSAQIVGQLKIANTSNVCFNNFTIYPAEYQDYSCVFMSLSTDFKLNNCRILNYYNINFDDDEALIKLSFPYSGAYFSSNIDSCLIISDETFYVTGSQGSEWFRNNIIRGTLTSKTKEAKIGHKRHFYNNIFYCSDDNFRNTGQDFHECTFYFESIFDLRLQGNVYNCIFHCTLDLSATDIIGNIFYDYVDMKWLNNSNFYNNIAYGEVRSTFSHGIKMLNNIFHKKCSNNNDNTKFGNNIVYDTLSFSHGPGQQIFNNNFKKNSRLEIYYCSALIKNNNLGEIYLEEVQLPEFTLENNNFQTTENVVVFGENPHFYNPQYDSNLYSTNLMLIGKGGDFSTYFKYDIDSILRKDPCTIGANEICFNWEIDEIYLNCMDSVNLDICIDTLIDMYWSPSFLFSDTTSANPKIFPEDSLKVYLNSMDGLHIDSLQINTEPSAPTAFASFTMDGSTVSFKNESHCAKHYLWDFGDEIISTEKSPIHEYAEEGNYICELNVWNSIDTAKYYLQIILIGINENNHTENKISINPNPANNSIIVKSKDEIIEYSLINIYGHIILTEKINNIKSLKMDISFLENGLYFLKLKSRKNTVITRFLKLN